MLDGGIFLLGLYSAALLAATLFEWRLISSLFKREDRMWAAVVTAVNVGTLALVFTFVPFATQVGLQYWFLEGASARRDGSAVAQVTPWLLIAGDFTPLGGMDVANLALARHLAGRGDELHVVGHRVWDDLARHPGVNVHRVWRPFGRHLFGSPLLAREGQRVWRTLRGRGGRAIANGGNCALADANWVHYLHTAFVPQTGMSRPRAIQTVADASPRRGGRASCVAGRPRGDLQQRADPQAGYRIAWAR